MRTFISLNPDDKTKSSILDVQNDLRIQISKLSGRPLNSIKWETIDKFHITLFFIGEIDKSRLSKVDRYLAKVNTDLQLNDIVLESGSINAFPKLRYPRVLILELTNEDKKIFELSDMIIRSLIAAGLENEKKFHPHITLGRVRRDHKINLSDINSQTVHKVKFSINEFCLMESKLKSSGSEHSILKKYKL